MQNTRGAPRPNRKAEHEAGWGDAEHERRRHKGAAKSQGAMTAMGQWRGDGAVACVVMGLWRGQWAVAR